MTGGTITGVTGGMAGIMTAVMMDIAAPAVAIIAGNR
jgi:hypothetical protein